MGAGSRMKGWRVWCQKVTSFFLLYKQGRRFRTLFILLNPPFNDKFVTLLEGKVLREDTRVKIRLGPSTLEKVKMPIYCTMAHNEFNTKEKKI